jgi:hypothetical protein
MGSLKGKRGSWGGDRSAAVCFGGEGVAVGSQEKRRCFDWRRVVAQRV